MPNKNELYHFTHTSPEIRTLKDLLDNISSPAYLYNTQPEKFLSIVGEDGLTNRQRIESTYKLPEEKIYIGAGWSKLMLLVGTILYLEYDKVNQQSFLTQGIEVVSNDEPAFKAQALAKIESDEGYVSLNEPVNGQTINGISKEVYPDVTVWIWCRSLSKGTDEGSELKGQFFDLTPFISNLSTNTSKNGGSFLFTLPPLMCEQDSDNKWILKEGHLDQYVNNNDASLQGDGYVAHSTLFSSKSEDEPLVRSQFLFHNIISSNDLVFIRFETLEMEKDQRFSDANEFYLSKKNIADRIYDMIGLVDRNIQSVSPQNNDVTTTVSGTDLMKLFIADGTYFYALENSQGMLKFAGQSTQKNSLLNRIFADGALNFIGLYEFTSIEYILKFIIQQLSNIKVVPNDLFESYGDRRNKSYTDFGSAGIDNAKRDQLKTEAIGHIKSLRTKNSLTLSDDKLEAVRQTEIFLKMARFLERIRVDKNRTVNDTQKTQSWKSFVFEGEKVEDNTYPFYFSDNLFSAGSTVDNEVFTFSNTVDKYIDAGIPSKRFKEYLAPGIWQIIKLVIDKSVSNRVLANSSLSTANGSLINFIRSACQEPLVEFYGDTYGDTYNLIVRRPPYDQKGLISLIEGKVNTEDGSILTKPAIVTIKQSDVLKESLGYDDSQIYSWYHFFPQSALIGDAGQYSLSYIGALYFPEYADIWGSKPFQQAHNYLPYIPLKNLNDTVDIYEEQAIQDLKYVIETSQYLPFTRKGTITVNPDRRLKIGNIFRYEATGEIGFITSVQQSFQIGESGIERTTTIQVERLMIEQLIYGQYLNTRQGDDPKFVSYFNIINTNLVFNRKKTLETTTRTIAKAKTSTVVGVKPNTAATFPPRSFANDNQIKMSGNLGMNYLQTYNQKPDNKKLFVTFINSINKLGYKVYLSPRGATRTHSQQAALKLENKYNAVAGTSKHERGDAIDITLVNFKDSTNFCNKNTPEATWRATGIPALANSMGLQWGGPANNGTFGTYVDRVHFEVANIKSNLTNLPVNEDYIEVTQTTEKMVLDREGVFQNFKVNKESFNFFLKKRQTGEDFRKVTSRLINDNGGGLLDEIRIVSTKTKK